MYVCMYICTYVRCHSSEWDALHCCGGHGAKDPGLPFGSPAWTAVATTAGTWLLMLVHLRNTQVPETRWLGKVRRLPWRHFALNTVRSASPSKTSHSMKGLRLTAGRRPGGGRTRGEEERSKGDHSHVETTKKLSSNGSGFRLCAQFVPTSSLYNHSPVLAVCHGLARFPTGI